MLMQSGSLGLQNLISDSYRFAHRPPRRAATALQTQRRGRVGAGGAPIGARDPPGASGPAPARGGGIRTPQGPLDGRLQDPLWGLRWIFPRGPIWDHSRSPLRGLLWSLLGVPSPLRSRQVSPCPVPFPAPWESAAHGRLHSQHLGVFGDGSCRAGLSASPTAAGSGEQSRTRPPGAGRGAGAPTFRLNSGLIGTAFHKPRASRETDKSLPESLHFTQMYRVLAASVI